MTKGIQQKSFSFRGQAVDVLEALKDRPYPFLLESSLRRPGLGRFSFLGADPFLVVKGEKKNSLAHLNRHFERYARFLRGCRRPFPGGIMGYLSYDFGLSLEPGLGGSNAPKPDASRVPGYLFGFYDVGIMIDHAAGKLTVLSTGLPAPSARRRLRKAQERLAEMTSRLTSRLPAGKKVSRPAYFGKGPRRHDLPSLKSNFTKAEYLKAVRRVLDYIRAGDIYQVNLSQRFFCDAKANPKKIEALKLYRILRERSPSCFSGYFDAGDFKIVSSSPERFLEMHDDVIQTRPMKGTRPRGRGPVQDKRNAGVLWKSRKDIAELLMITDLERNDLGRVCRYGSVHVREMRALEKYATVFQTTSTVTGRIKENKNIFDCLRETFPGGSITGCPKIRAMQIINELEPSPRSIYTGAMGYVGFSGRCDFNILIRTFLVRGRRVYFHAGGGIVADSVPEREYEETLVKARAMRECLGVLLHAKDKS